MLQLRTINKVFIEDGLPVGLVKGDGYFYYVYDLPQHGVYETQSEYVCRLSDLTKDEWISMGRVFAIEVAHSQGVNL